MSHPDSPTAVESLGARLDAILAPFTADERRLQDTISELEAKVAEMQADIEGSRTDLSVVQSSKVESLREAAKSDPLLSMVFTGMADAQDSAPPAESTERADASADSGAAEPREEPAGDGGHSLLKM